MCYPYIESATILSEHESIARKDIFFAVAIKVMVVKFDALYR